MKSLSDILSKDLSKRIEKVKENRILKEKKASINNEMIEKFFLNSWVLMLRGIFWTLLSVYVGLSIRTWYLICNYKKYSSCTFSNGIGFIYLFCCITSLCVVIYFIIRLIGDGSELLKERLEKHHIKYRR